MLWFGVQEEAMTKERILEIIEDLLQYGKINEHRISYNRALLDLAQRVIEEEKNDGEDESVLSM